MFRSCQITWGYLLDDQWTKARYQNVSAEKQCLRLPSPCYSRYGSPQEPVLECLIIIFPIEVAILRYAPFLNKPIQTRIYTRFLYANINLQMNSPTGYCPKFMNLWSWGDHSGIMGGWVVQDKSFSPKKSSWIEVSRRIHELYNPATHSFADISAVWSTVQSFVF